MFILDKSNQVELAVYLKNQGWIAPNALITSVSIAGEGNMNYVLRVVTGRGSLIVKQSRGYVEKYPQISAPANRAVTEGEFYRTVQTDNNIAGLTPTLIGIDRVNNIIALSDLGHASDFSFLYRSGEQLQDSQLKELVDFLGRLHTQSHMAAAGNLFQNKDMRTLNHQHIFIYPFLEENGFDLDNIQIGLQTASMVYKKDYDLKKQIEALGEIYLSTGNYLLHGDFYPGSWLWTKSGVKIIDPEFCFYGPREFDLGVMIAHLYLSTQQDQLIKLVPDTYPSNPKLDVRLLHQFTGIEMMRRIIGIAQLPLTLTVTEKEELLNFAKSLILAKKV
jgi:5-methylthioribose kinase